MSSHCSVDRAPGVKEVMGSSPVGDFCCLSHARITFIISSIHILFPSSKTRHLYTFITRTTSLRIQTSYSWTTTTCLYRKVFYNYSNRSLTDQQEADRSCEERDIFVAANAWKLRRGKGAGGGGGQDGKEEPHQRFYDPVILVVYHLPKNTGHFGWHINGKTILVRPNGKFPK